MKFRAFIPLALVATAAAVGACKDTTGTNAIVRFATDTMVASTVSGTPLSAPAALSLVGFRTDTTNDIFADPFLMRVDSIFDFDLAFDIDQAGKAVLLTPQAVGNLVAVRAIPTAVGSSAIGPHRVGLQLLPAGTNFEAVQESPTGGFVFDSLLRVEKGTVIAMQSYVSFCATSIRPYLFAKLVVDSILPASRKVGFRVALNRNCGYRSFRPGIPSN